LPRSWHEVVLEISELARARNGNVSGTQGVLQLSHYTEFVKPAIDSFRAEHVALPPFANEGGRRIGRDFAQTVPIHLSQEIAVLCEAIMDASVYSFSRTA